MLEQRILIVEDESAIREMLHIPFHKAGFILEEAADISEARVKIFNQMPSLILLDWMLPNISGIEFAHELKRNAQTKEIPIIMLTAKGEETDKVRGLEVGADDYVTKPFSPRELVARIKAVLRRTVTHSHTEKLEIRDLSLDLSEHRVTISDTEVAMGPTEFRLLQFFMSHPEKVYSREQVLNHVWGGNVYIEERTVDVHIRRLRKALATYGYDHLIQTVRGVGYRLSAKE